ncbi:MAG: chemotaxis protein CheW [Sandaracinaceae bacterium]|nr:chemotaxis protein CheW [Sandaracinaceae bacterium]
MSPTRDPAALVVHVGSDLFAIPCTDVVSVLPLPELRPLPGAPAGLLGTFSYGGAIVPVIDLAQALTGVATDDCLAVRVVISNTRDGLVGVLVGRVADVRRVGASDRRLDVARHSVVADAVVIDGRPVHMLALGSALPPELRGLMAAP